MGVAAQLPVKQDLKSISKEKLHFDADQCPCCKKGIMETILDFEPNAPPAWVLRKLRIQQYKITP